MTAPLTIVNPPELGAPRGFAHGVIMPAAGRTLLVAGQIGTDGSSSAAGFTAQFDRALARVLVVVRAAGGRPEDIARMTVYVTDMDGYRNSRADLRAVWERHLGSHYPAMALVGVTSLVDPAAMVEIDATAVLP